MNWWTHLAIFFGRRKFEEFAQANPELPDDALAIANTLDTYLRRFHLHPHRNSYGAPRHRDHDDHGQR